MGNSDTIALASEFAATSTQMKRGLEKFKRELPEVALYLEGLNDKLDLLVRLLAAADNELSDQPTHDVSLSAGGLSFDARTEIPKNSSVEIKLLVFPSYICIRTFGTVVYCRREKTDNSEFPFRVGIDFSYIRENDRELLIKHVLRKQSSRRREARGDKSGEVKSHHGGDGA